MSEAVSGPDVTVVIPFHDTVATVEQAVRSALEQRIGALEVLCVDDRSSDGSREIVEEIARRDPRVRVLDAPVGNRGPGLPRNLGIDAASGRYLAFLDSDDRFTPRGLSRLLRLAERHDLDVAMGAIDTFDDEGRHRARCSYRETIGRELARRAFSADELGPGILDLRFVAWNKLYRMSFVRDNALRFSENVFYEDLNFTFPALLRAGRIGFDRSTVVLNRRGRPGSTTTLQGDRVVDAVEEFARFAQLLADEGREELGLHFAAHRFRKLLSYLPRTDVANLVTYHSALVDLARSLPAGAVPMLRPRERQALDLLTRAEGRTSREELLLWSAWQEHGRRKRAERTARRSLVRRAVRLALRR